MRLLLLTLPLTAVLSSPASWPCTWSAPPHDTPSSTWPDGPHVGDGNQGLVIGGAPGEVTIYGTVHGFWGVSYGSNASMPPLSQHRTSGDGAVGSAFPGCPAEDCSITVGLTLARFMVAAPQLSAPGASWNATLDISSGTATVDMRAGAAALRITLLQHATAGIGLLTLENTGAVALSPLNVSLAGNGNIRNVPVAVGCGLASAATPCPPTPQDLPALCLTKDANPQGVASPMPIQGAAGLAPLGSLPAGSATPLATRAFSAQEPASDWAKGGAKVPTLTSGLTHALALPPGSTVAFATAMAASRDPGVYPDLTALQAVALRLGAVSLGDLPALRASHAAWWRAFYTASAVSLEGEGATEAFFYSALYALGSGTRAGQTVMDLWSPWRTTDYSAWRSSMTLDYNQQALYSGVYALNLVDLATPYYDFLAQAVADGGPQLEAAALNCSTGIHLSVDLAPYGLKMGVRGEVQDWGIRSNAVYAAVLYSYHWDVVPHDDAGVLEWARGMAFPFLTLVANFWACYLTRHPVPSAPNGVRYWSVGDCNGDENCNAGLSPQQATNPVWTLTYLRRLLATLPSMATALGLPLDPAWEDVLLHLPPTATTLVAAKGSAEPVAVLSMYGEGSEGANVTQARAFATGQQPGYLHSLWPGETLSPLSEDNATLAAAALATFDFAPFSQDNAFSWVFSAAARAGVAPNVTQAHWRRSLNTQPVRENRLYAWGGLCSDSLGAVQYIVDMLVQGREGFLRAFPAWPGNASASFQTLRMPGALLVSGVYQGAGQGAEGQSGEQAGGTVYLGVRALGSEAGGSAPRNVTVLSPWQGAARERVVVCLGSSGACAGGARHENLTWGVVGGPRGGAAFSWMAQAATAAEQGKEYMVFLNP